MTELRPAPYGSWPSPITSELIVSDTVGIGQVEVDGDGIWWAEARPAEQGRVVVVRRRADGGIADAFGPGWNARTRVHEYGGGCFAVDGDTPLFTHHPDLPWDGTHLWVADLDAYGKPGDPVLVAGGPRESVLMPVWSPGGVLHLVSDRTGWWNLYRWRGDGELEALCPAEMEFARPAWLLGWTTYAFLGEEHIACTATRRGEWRLYQLPPPI